MTCPSFVTFVNSAHNQAAPCSTATRGNQGLSWIRRYGSPALLLAWVPIVGDPLCVAAGWRRVNPWLAALCMALGQFARYLANAAVAA